MENADNIILLVPILPSLVKTVWLSLAKHTTTQTTIGRWGGKCLSKIRMPSCLFIVAIAARNSIQVMVNVSFGIRADHDA